MLRHLAAVLLMSSLALPAEAAIAAKSEKGVRVWRAPAATAGVAAPSLKGAASPCVHRTVVVVDNSEPARRLRTHRWNGETWDERLPLTTTGYFSDRIAAGL
jgi:hypothetical protein